MIKKPDQDHFRENEAISLARETSKQVERARPALRRKGMALFGMWFAPLVLVPIFTWLNHSFPALLTIEGQYAIFIGMFVIIYFTFLRPEYKHLAEKRREGMRTRYQAEIDEAASLRREVFGDQ
jgi:hypothetical protein